MKSFISSWAGHLAGYLVAGAGLVAGINPKLLPPQYAFMVDLAGLVVIGAHHGFKAGQVSGALTAAAQAATAALQKVPPAAAVAALALLSFGGLSGCATVQSFFASPASGPIITIAVDVAVAEAETKGVQAAKINNIAKLALAADASPTATLATVAAVANAEIAKLNLPPLDMAAAQVLEVAISAAIQQKLTNADGTLNTNLAAAQADVATVLQAVIAATGG